MLLNNLINNSKHKEFLEKTIIYNLVINFFLKEKSIDISKNLISVKIINRNLVIKLDNPLIKFELSLLKAKFLEEILKHKYKFNIKDIIYKI